MIDDLGWKLDEKSFISFKTELRKCIFHDFDTVNNECWEKLISIEQDLYNILRPIDITIRVNLFKK
jgi:hypothetical protein